MILIVADTGPVNYLIQIGCIGVLAQMAEKTVLPKSVQAELLHPAAPDVVQAWAAAPPAWVEIRTALRLIEAKDMSTADREAISLAQEMAASVLLMDDHLARRSATSRGVVTMGTVGLLEAAAARDLVKLPGALERLRGTSCYLSDELMENALQRDAERQRLRETH